MTRRTRMGSLCFGIRPLWRDEGMVGAARRMTVAFNALSLRPGIFDGAATYTLNVLRHLPEACPDVEFVVYRRPGERRIPPAPNLRTKTVTVAATAPLRIGAELALLSPMLRRDCVMALLSPNESIPLA